MANKCVTCGDCSYNIMKQLVKTNELLWNIDGYIKDAKKAKHKKCQQVMEQIKKDNMKNARALNDLIKELARKNKF
jgi:pyruvate-formate lyase-activating enzyme